MELSQEVLEGLQLSGDSSKIPDKIYETFIQSTCKSLLEKSRSTDIPEDGAEPGVVKQAFSAVATLLLEAAKHDQPPDSLSHILEDSKFTPDRIEVFNKIYAENKDNLRILLSSTGNNPPHIVDVSWRLDYYVKNNHLDKVSQPVFLINLKTEECGEPDQKDLQLACTQEQLQDMVGKLRDACKSLERAAQT